MPSYLVFLDFEGDRMEVEYFPPKGDVILQNAAPADLYILVVGAVVKILPYTVIILGPLLLTVCHLHQITLSYMLVYLTGTHLAKR